MKSYSLGKINEEMLVYSMRPQRFPRLVNLVRKILWQWIRPFHFYQIEEFYKLHEQQNQELMRFKKMVQGQEEKIKKFLAATSFTKSDLSYAARSEYIPLINRIAYLENENESLKVSLEEIKKFLK